MTTDDEQQLEARTVAARCVSTCRYLACTGRGSLEPWAHVCLVLGIPKAVPTCAVDGCSEPGALMPRGRRCVAHRPAVPVPGPPTRPSPEWIWPLEYGPEGTR